MTEEMESTQLEAYEQQAIELANKSKEIQIVDLESFNIKGVFEQTAAENIRMIKEHIRPQKEEANRKHKRLTQLEKRLCEPYESIRKECRDARIGWQAEQERLAREAEMQRVREEQERRRLEIQAEQERSRAQNAQQTHEDGPVEAIAPEEVQSPPKPVTPEYRPIVPRVKNLRVTYYAELVDLKALCLAIGQGQVSLPRLTPAEKDQLMTILKFNAQARQDKDFMAVPGIEVRERRS